MKLRLSDFAGPTPYTGEDPQTSDNNRLEDKSMEMSDSVRPDDIRPDYTVAPERAAEEYNWAMSGTHVVVSDDDHGAQFQNLEWNDFSRPYCYGKLELYYNWTASWHVYYTNLSHHIVEQRLKRYTRDQGWEWGGLLDEDGMPPQLRSLKQASVPGIGEINPGLKDWKRDEWSGMGQYDNPADHQSPFYGEQDPPQEGSMGGDYICSDCGMPCTDHNDLRLHVMREHVNPEHKPPPDPQPVVDLDDALPAHWDKSIMDMTVQRQSRILHALTVEKPRNFIREAMGQNGDLPTGLQFIVDENGETDNGDPAIVCRAYLGNDVVGELKMCAEDSAYTTEGKIATIWTDPKWQRRGIATEMLEYMRKSGYDVKHDWGSMSDEGEAWANKVGAATQTPDIQGPIPFVYDIETDRIFVGHPGERHSDIQGRFTPGGIVEGVYDPKGNIQIRTDTDMPYTVRHMGELWYALHPELQIKAIYLLQGDKKYRLASANIGHQVRNLTATDPAAWAAYKALEPHGNVYAVGGVVRDVVLGKTPKDVDLMVQGVDPEEVEEILEQLPGRVDLTGESFGVFRYRDPEGNEVEIALPRTERSTGPGHKDFEVYTDPYISVGEDLARRDFTGNAMAVNLTTGDLVDPYHGSEHLKSGVLEPVSDRSLVEDPLRILRAFSAVSRHGLLPTQATHHDLAAHAGSLNELPKERLQMELDKIMSGDDPAKAVELMEQTGVLEHVLPDVAATIGFDQKNPHHAYSLNEHLREVLDNTVTQTKDLDARYAALLHDIGKPASQWISDDGVGHYYKNEKGEGQQHEEVGADMARKLLTELKFPTDRVDRISHLILHHMFPVFSSSSGARKFINRVGDEHADDLLNFRQADIAGKGLANPTPDVDLMRQYVQGVRDAGEPTDRGGLAINGKDLIQAGIKPGPEMGTILDYLTNLVLEDPSLNERETLLGLAMQSRTASFEDGVMYHVSPVSARQSIQQHGLAWHMRTNDTWGGRGVDEYGSDFYPEGNYLWGTYNEAEEYVHSVGSSGSEWDIWQVDVRGLENLEWDPQSYDETESRLGVEDIEPSRLKLVDTETAQDWEDRYGKTSNILDPIKDELDPDVFNHADSIDPDVKPKICEWVKKKVYQTMIDAGWPDPSKYLNLILTGSLTTYQWGEESDFDVSLWIDVERFPEYARADLIALMIENLDGTIVPGTTHPIQNFVVDPTHFSKTDLYKPGLRSAYDLDAKKWLVLPEKSRAIDVGKTWPEVVRYAHDCVNKLKMMIRYDKYAVKTYYDYLHRRRSLDMRAGKGDYSESNIIYKMIANENLHPIIEEITGEHIASVKGRP